MLYRWYYDFLQTPVSKDRAKQMNPVTLAYVGDAVYTLLIRTRLTLESGERAGEIERRVTDVVSAHGQSIALEKILPLLTEEESDIFHRGRNAKKATKSKNASAGEYARSTGFEALVGYLYLTGQRARIEELLSE